MCRPMDAEEFEALAESGKARPLQDLAKALEDLLNKYGQEWQDVTGDPKLAAALAQSATCMLLASNAAKFTDPEHDAEFIESTGRCVRKMLPSMRRALIVAKANDVRFACRNPGTVN